MKHYEETAPVYAPIEQVFAFADDHKNLASHMNKSSWMMGGGKMETKADEGNGQQLGSHIKMDGKIFGIRLFLDEFITKYEPPYRKEWKTAGDINLFVIGHYTLGFEITPADNVCHLKVYIKYNLPESLKTYWLGLLFGKVYAKWCVHQMVNGVKNHFLNRSS